MFARVVHLYLLSDRVACVHVARVACTPRRACAGLRNRDACDRVTRDFPRLER